MYDGDGTIGSRLNLMKEFLLVNTVMVLWIAVRCGVFLQEKVVLSGVVVSEQGESENRLIILYGKVRTLIDKFGRRQCTYFK